MALIDKQIKSALTLITDKFIQQGRIPSQAALVRETSEFTERVDGGPTFRPLSATRLKRFDVKAWNREMWYVQFDLDNMFKELITQAILLMKRTGWADTVYRAQRGQLDRIIGALDDIMFVKANLEDHFLGFSDTMTDYAKLDLANSTPGVHNLAEKCALIPPAPMGTERIRLEDKLMGTSQPITVNSPEGTDLIRSSTPPDAPFANIFHDLSVIWRHDVITRNDDGCEIQFTFPLDNAESPYQISKISLTPTSESEMKAKFYWSYDGANYTLMPSSQEWVALNRMATATALDFEAVNMRYIRIILRKEDADEVVNNGYRYTFGIKNFSVYKVSRLPQATYQTVVMTPQYGVVEKVALEVQDYIPAGCFIDYYVADETGEFLPIAPSDRADPQAPRVVRFGDMREVWNRWSATGELAYNYNSLNYYKTNATALSGDYHFGMCDLYRGKGSWARETSVIEELQTTRDTFIQFTKDTQKLYTYTDAEVTGETLIGPDQTNRTVLTVPSGDVIYYDRNIAGHLVRPADGTDIDIDDQPKYAVAQVLAIRNDGYMVTGETFVLSSSTWATLTYRNVDEAYTPQVYWKSYEDLGIPWTGPLVEDNDPGFSMDKWPGEGNYYNGKIRMSLQPPRDGIGPYGEDPVPAKVTYRIKRDVTHLVRDINVAKGQIWLAHTVDADKFQIRYRIVPENVIRKSVTVTERRGEDQGETYKEGSDYIISVAQGTIVRPEGSKISAGGSCYVDYQWVKEKYNLETFSVWCYYDRDEPTTILFSAPDMDKDGGETFFMDISGGRYDLLESSETPILSRGWYRFSVESKPISESGAGIRLVLALKDRDGDPIFSGSKYFGEIRAFRSPMKQVSEAKLKFGTRKDDRGVFAIDGNGYVIVNFDPNNSDDITTLRYDETSDSLVERTDFFELMRVISSGQTAKGVKLRAVLRRNPNVQPGTTPKLYGWSIRISR